MIYILLVTSERVKIETYIQLSHSIQKIIEHLGYQPSTSKEYIFSAGYIFFT